MLWIAVHSFARFFVWYSKHENNFFPTNPNLLVAGAPRENNSHPLLLTCGLNEKTKRFIYFHNARARWDKKKNRMWTQEFSKTIKSRSGRPRRYVWVNGRSPVVVVVVFFICCASIHCGLMMKRNKIVTWLRKSMDVVRLSKKVKYKSSHEATHQVMDVCRISLGFVSKIE